MNIDKNTVFCLREGISVRHDRDDIYYLYDVVNGDVFEINETTKVIIDKIMLGKNAEIIFNEICEIDRESNEVTYSDVEYIIIFLLENSLIAKK